MMTYGTYLFSAIERLYLMKNSRLIGEPVSPRQYRERLSIASTFTGTISYLNVLASFSAKEKHADPIERLKRETFGQTAALSSVLSGAAFERINQRFAKSQASLKCTSPHRER
jgi:hypothetical protein